MVMGRKPDTPEEAEIRKQIEAKNIKGLSPKMVLRIPKTELEPLVYEGLRDHEICKNFQVSHGVISWLRKYYGLPFISEVQEMLACITPEPEPEPTIEETLTGKTIEHGPTYTATEMPDPQQLEKCADEIAAEPTEPAAGPIPRQEIVDLVMDTFAPLSDRLKRECLDMMKLKTQEFQKQEGEFALPLLDIKGPGEMAAPLVNGVAKHLDRLGDEVVEVIVTVRRVEE